MDKDKDHITEEIEDTPEAKEDDKSSEVKVRKSPGTDSPKAGSDQAETGTSKSKRKPKAAKKLSQKEILAHMEEKNRTLMDLNRKYAEISDELMSTKDKWIRSVADFENYRKRAQKEWELLKQQAEGEIFLEVLNVVDDFERAFLVVGERDDEFVDGIRLIYQNLLSSLGKFGIKKMEALHVPFDPNYHMAIGQIETEEVDSNHVVEVVQQGYLLNTSVLRPARVIVAK
jgi:molecular chaperone GrpE